MYQTSCDSGEVGIDTLHLISTLGCDSSIIIETTLLAVAQTELFEFTCNIDEEGMDTLILQNQNGCDSIVITNYEFIAPVVAVDDHYAVEIGKVLLENIFDNDQFELDNLSIHLNTDLINFEVNDQGELLFRPNKNNDKMVIVEYEICDNRCDDNCDSATISIEIIDNSVYVPSGISPNGDGKNDVWIIPSLENNEVNRLIILNRWGQTVLDAEPYQNDWAGTSLQGKKLPEGTYYYHLTIGKNFNKYKSGTITILR